MAEEDDPPVPDIPMTASCRRFSPRSGYEFLATITGRPIEAAHWIAIRVTQLSAMRWSFRGIKRMLAEECEREPWSGDPNYRGGDLA